MDARVLALAPCTTVLAAVVFGVAPALAAARRAAYDALRDGARGTADSPRRRRVRAALVVSEFAMALVLLATAGLVVRSFASLRAVDGGYDVRDVVTMRVSLKGTSAAASAERRAAFFHELAQKVAALPQVEAVGLTNHLPLHGDHWRFPYAVEGAPRPRPDERASASFRVVMPGYFRAMRIPILAGRDFAEADEAARAHVVVINETLARRAWPNERALGRRISVDDPATGADWFTVVGLVKEVRQGSWSEGRSEEM